MTNPDQLASQVEQTRDSLSKDIARLNERISPAHAVDTRVDKIRSSTAAIKDRLLGAKDGGLGAARDKAASAVGSVQDGTSTAAAKFGDVAGNTPPALREQTQGNPVAAGLIAFGVGWLLSSLVPVTAGEQRAAAKVEDNADVVLQPLKESAQEVATNLQEPLQNSAEAMKKKTTDAVDRTTEHARSAADDVRGEATQAKDSDVGQHRGTQT